MGYPSCCAPSMFLQESCQGCSGEGPGSEDPECPKVDPCRRLPPKAVRRFFLRRKSSPSLVHGWLCQCARPEIALCSTSNSLSYPRTRTPLSDGDILKTAQLPLFVPIPLDFPDHKFLSLRGSRAKRSRLYSSLD